MKEDLENIQNLCLEEISNCRDLQELDNIRVKYLGKKGELTLILRNMGNVSEEERPIVGQMVNKVRNEIGEILDKNKAKLKDEKILEKIKNAKRFDFTIPTNDNIGSLHPITIVQKEVEEVFKSMGFTIETGNEVESDFNNFEAVNVPKYHPARDMQDTFWLENGQLLKTHTSASQNRIMKKYGAPLKAVFPGRCFRNEDIDASHDNTFFQMEGMMIDKDISISNTIYFMKIMLSEIFKKDLEVRLRPGYFPFVEPGFELDISCIYCSGKGCRVCKNSGWIELCPCGIIHPNVLKMGGIDPEDYSGFAFGLGLSRLAMMKYQISDLRLLHSGDLRVLKQMKVN